MKTWKRETAIGLFVGLFAFAGWGAAGNESAIEVVSVLALPVILFGMGAFGLDAVSKQINIDRRE